MFVAPVSGCFIVIFSVGFGLGTRKGVVRSTFSVRITPDQFIEQKRVQTTEELVKLVDEINLSPYHSIKQKSKLLHAVQRKHPDVFGQYFSHTSCAASDFR